MKKLIFLLLISFTTKCFAVIPTISEVRLLYKKAASGEKHCKELISLLKPYTEKNNPLLSGYKAGVTMMMARYSFNPFSKLSYFKKGKEMLEKAIAADGTNVELRFLRFAAQTNAPSFLGYDDNIDKDKIFLLQSIPHLIDITLKETIVTYLKNSSSLSTEQKRELK